MLLGPVLGLAAVACGGMEAGDYWVYRVAEVAQEVSDGCYYPETEPPQSVESDSSTVLSSRTVVVYHAGDERRVFDDGVIALAGKDSGDTFEFTGTATDNTYLGDDGAVAVLTATTVHQVIMTIDGRTVTGLSLEDVTTRCEFLTAIPMGEFCPNPQVPDCRRKTNWFGVQLDDVRLSDKLVDPPD
jgi:hypothetical protein